MEKEIYEEWYAQLESELAVFKESRADVATGMTGPLSIVRKYLVLLRRSVSESGFADTASEVAFFKRVKPRFYRWLIFFTERYAMVVNEPVGDENERRKYYLEQFRYLDRVLRQYAFYYEYYRLGATELDHLWFVRGAGSSSGWVLDVPEADPAFGTAQDYLFSKFMAYELLREELMAKLVEGADIPLLTSRKGRALRWTGDSCNLVELVYGIYEMRQVNGGEVDLSDLMDVFELVFQVNLSRYFRRFTEIKRRKTISKTKFLDQMRDAVNKRIDDGDALPAKGKAKSSVRDSLDLLKNNPYL